ncbi:MAG: hypothetical protein IPK32_02020 [Verrucomicrobiaceae bacterium]|nr:hypothetical protein [Verrucomicrobiaceae bacterium]
MAPSPPAPPIPQQNDTVRVFIDDALPGFRELTATDIAPVNSAADTWSWQDGTLHCTGMLGLPQGIEVQVLDYG